MPEISLFYPLILKRAWIMFSERNNSVRSVFFVLFIDYHFLALLIHLKDLFTFYTDILIIQAKIPSDVILRNMV